MSQRNNRKPKNKTMKKINCGPLGKNSNIKDSCLTKDVLFKLKEGFNDKYPDNIIKSTQPTQIWTELNNNLKHCDKETCWLDVLPNRNLRNRVENLLYAPQKPIEWKLKPNTWLSNHDILGVMEQYEVAYSNFRFIGPSPIDFDKRPAIGYGDFCKSKSFFMGPNCVCSELCNFDINDYKQEGIEKIGVCFNLDKHTQGGSHWVSMFIDLKEKYIFYFDSTGHNMPKEISVLVERISSQGPFKKYVNKLEHQRGNSECGMYTLMFLITMLSNKWYNGRSKKHVQFKNSREKIGFFRDKRISDYKVAKFRDIYFNE
jgi:hypothetical protein